LLFHLAKSYFDIIFAIPFKNKGRRCKEKSYTLANSLKNKFSFFPKKFASSKKVLIFAFPQTKNGKLNKGFDKKPFFERNEIDDQI